MIRQEFIRLVPEKQFGGFQDADGIYNLVSYDRNGG
jgi:hypothetical protein